MLTMFIGMEYHETMEQHGGALMKILKVREYFEALGLDIWDAWSFFKLLDHGGDGSVDLEDFFDGCLRFRGPARAMDMGRIMQDQRPLWGRRGRRFFWSFMMSFV
ncbi:unnamed protein product [Durusdinium trenchii]|uniref:Calmodulin n=1 Tax=Durusdinium trenchii TaxID=1381693 RepID=A0ABP0LI20_9DINO